MGISQEAEKAWRPITFRPLLRCNAVPQTCRRVSETQWVKAVGRRELELRAFPKKMSCGLRLRVLAACLRQELLTRV